MNTKITFLIGLDCDRPRGIFSKTPEGMRMAEVKYFSLRNISISLNKLGIPRTYFICGSFLESMVDIYGVDNIRNVFLNEEELCEISDHSYSHNVIKNIPTRPDKIPLSLDEVEIEIRNNTLLFSKIFGENSKPKGFRSPLGHFEGLRDADQLQDLFLSTGFQYISSDIRDHNHSIFPGFVDPNNNLRQPYYYNNGLLEIPGHGWHDTAFGNESKTPLFLTPPNDYAEILNYYRDLIKDAKAVAKQNNKDRMYVGLVLHPYNVALYDKKGTFFEDLSKICQAEDIDFCKYIDVYNHHRSKKSL